MILLISISKKESLLFENRIEEKNLSKEKERQSGLISGLKRKERAIKMKLTKTKIIKSIR